ncbi:hypothetical protein LEP1GSC188_4251 [Leptospira weilii serovar Topaz str. LT2116]|uniref:Uncharacterized protein n=1 Tax=Leptospira weilii serovar Topaz str. LT2116 TaxID=1088540 RepID=M3GDI3_9LEPT|nr:hypothetical protein LEP1GSC188_4251 [Leptospira weilii serovar Topaz str. LT2116]
MHLLRNLSYYSNARIEYYDKLISKIRILESFSKKPGFPDLT